MSFTAKGQKEQKSVYAQFLGGPSVTGVCA